MHFYTKISFCTYLIWWIGLFFFLLHIDSTAVSRKKDCEIDFEPCSKLEDLNLDVRNNAEDIEERNLTETIYGR